MNKFKNMLFYMAMLCIPSLSFSEEFFGIDQKIDQFFTIYFGWFASAIFYGVKVEDGVTFPIIVGWLFVAAIIFTFYFGLYYLMPIVKKELNSFLSRVESGEIKKYK